MRMLSRIIISSLMMLNSAFAQDCKSLKAACDKALKAGDAYIAELKVENEMQKHLLDQQITYSNTIQKELDKKSSELNSWYRQPENMLLLGLFIGLVAGVSTK